MEPKAFDRPISGHSFRAVSIVLAALFLVSLILYLFTMRDLRAVRADLEKVRQEQIKLMEDYRVVLEENHRLLTRNLSERYFDSLIILRNRMEQGHAPSVEERKTALDRAGFIVENMGALELPPDEAKLRLQYLAGIRQLLEPAPSAQ